MPSHAQTRKCRQHEPAAPSHRKILRRTVAAAGVVVTILALQAPAWAGPMMGC